MQGSSGSSIASRYIHPFRYNTFKDAAFVRPPRHREALATQFSGLGALFKPISANQSQFSGSSTRLLCFGPLSRRPSACHTHTHTHTYTNYAHAPTCTHNSKTRHTQMVHVSVSRHQLHTTALTLKMPSRYNAWPEP